MSTSENTQLNEIYRQRKLFRNDRRCTMRFISAFAVMLVLLGAVIAVAGLLYIVKYSPDHDLIVLRDRKPPVASVHDAVSANGKVYTIEEFADTVSDISDVRMSYIKEPDYDKDGIQDIVIRFTDEAGNYTDKSLKLEVYHDTSAPVIYVDEDIYVFWNDAISYKSFAEVEDDYDEDDLY